MSISYTTNPVIPWEEFLKRTTLIVSEPEGEKYIPEVPTKIIKHPEYKDTLLAYKNEDGNVQFERFNIKDPELLYTIIKDFEVKIINEYGELAK